MAAVRAGSAAVPAAPILVGAPVPWCCGGRRSRAYLGHRQLAVATGSPFRRIGEVVVGATVARRLGAQVGTDLLVDVDSALDLAGEHGRSVRVVGILAPGHRS